MLTSTSASCTYSTSVYVQSSIQRLWGRTLGEGALLNFGFTPPKYRGRAQDSRRGEAAALNAAVQCDRERD